MRLCEEVMQRVLGILPVCTWNACRTACRWILRWFHDLNSTIDGLRIVLNSFEPLVVHTTFPLPNLSQTGMPVYQLFGYEDLRGFIALHRLNSTMIHACTALLQDQAESKIVVGTILQPGHAERFVEDWAFNNRQALDLSRNYAQDTETKVAFTIMDEILGVKAGTSRNHWATLRWSLRVATHTYNFTVIHMGFATVAEVVLLDKASVLLYDDLRSEPE